MKYIGDLPRIKNNKEGFRSRIAWLKKWVRAGDDLAAWNIAVTYRQAGNLKLAFQWWKRAAAAGDSDASTELGYCYQYGIGVRRNIRAAGAAYRRALRLGKYTPLFCKEEAYYHLAVLHLDQDKGRRGRTRAARLLRKAAADGDYPQAAKLLAQVKNGNINSICRCRRGLARRYGGKAQCPLHADKA